MKRTLITLLCLTCFTHGKNEKAKTVWTDPERTTQEHPAFPLIGEYKIMENGYFQITALKDGKFLMASYLNGLPGRGWNGKKAVSQVIDRAAAAKEIKNAQRITYTSPTIGKKPPTNAITMPDGFTNVKDGILWAGGKTKKDIGSFKMHVEFRLPYKPNRNPSHQDKGNSGIYIYNNYEVQVLDTFALDYTAEKHPILLKSKPTQWGGCLYRMKMADVNMCLPPLTWQTYDIEFTAPVFDGDKKIKNAIITVLHNGIKIHDNVELKTGTGRGAKRKQLAKGPIIFQNHGNPVAYRNVWIVETDSSNKSQ